MIKHGSGMALCLKYVANKVPSVAPLVVGQPHVSNYTRRFSQLSLRSPLVEETGLEKGGISSSHSTPEFNLGDLNGKEGNRFTNKCNADVMRLMSDLIFQDKCSFPKRRHLPSSSYDSKLVDVSHGGAFEDSKPSEYCGSENCRFSLLKNHEEPFICLSGLEEQNSSPGNRLGGLNQSQINSSPKSEDPFNPPSEEQLQKVVHTLSNDLPNFFVKPLDMNIYHPNIIFEDNIRGKRFSGRDQYNLQAKLLYLVGHIKFLFIRLDVLKITAHPEDGTVKVRWKINVFRLSRIHRVKIWDLSTSIQEGDETWVDGFSTYYVKGDGLVHKHVADKMIPDPHQMLKKTERTKTPAVPHPLAYSNRNKV